MYLCVGTFFHQTNGYFYPLAVHMHSFTIVDLTMFDTLANIKDILVALSLRESSFVSRFYIPNNLLSES